MNLNHTVKRSNGADLVVYGEVVFDKASLYGDELLYAVLCEDGRVVVGERKVNYDSAEFVFSARMFASAAGVVNRYGWTDLAKSLYEALGQDIREIPLDLGGQHAA